MAAGETVAQLAERVKHKFNIASTRAATIARTEVGAAVEEGRSTGRKQAGVPYKSWLWSRKEHGRPEHAATETATMADPVAEDQDFTIAGTSIRCTYPRASGVPGQDINCGCTTISRFEGDTLGKAVARLMQHGFLTYEAMIARDAVRLNHTTKQGTQGKDADDDAKKR